MMESNWQLVMRQERFKVVFTRLFYVLSACLSAPMRELSRSLNEFGALGVLNWCDVVWGGNFFLKMHSCAVCNLDSSYSVRLFQIIHLVYESLDTVSVLCIYLCAFTHTHLSQRTKVEWMKVRIVSERKKSWWKAHFNKVWGSCFLYSNTVAPHI